MKKIIIIILTLTLFSITYQTSKAQESVYSFDIQEPYFFDTEFIKVASIDVYKNNVKLCDGVIISFSNIEVQKYFIESARVSDEYDLENTFWLLSGSQKVVVVIPRELDIQDVLGINNYIARFY